MDLQPDSVKSDRLLVHKLHQSITGGYAGAVNGVAERDVPVTFCWCGLYSVCGLSLPALVRSMIPAAAFIPFRQ
jgi:hypothetical protein